MVSITTPSPAQTFSHEALFYAGDEGFVAGVAPFVRDGVALGEPVLVVAADRKLDLLRQSLNGEADHVLFADMAEVGANPARIIPAWRDFVARNAGRPVRGVGEPIYPERGADELVECQRHEAAPEPRLRELARLAAPVPVRHGGAQARGDRRGAPQPSERPRGGPPSPERAVPRAGRDRAPFGLPLLDPPIGAEQLAFDADALGERRRRVCRQGIASGLGVRRTTDLVLAVNEILTNSVRHGGGSGGCSSGRSRNFVCEVRDRGRIGDPLADRRRPEPNQTGGRGLWMANQLCDLVQLRSLPDGSIVRLSMRRDGTVSL